MPLDKIIVLVMAIAFFGGLIFLALKNRQKAAGESQPSSGGIQREEADENDDWPPQPRQKQRRKSRS